ncbi:MAG: ABC transporter permease, partial [Actinobacteria bacterium]|nr:ABC transporter permease [Actinomycetota bacterium]
MSVATAELAPDVLVSQRSRPPLAGPVAAGFIILVVLVGILAPVLAPADPLRQHLQDSLLPPGSRMGGTLYLLGTDDLGRDVLSRLIYGIRPLTVVVSLAVASSAAVGFVYGLVAGYLGGRVDVAMMRLADMQLSIPPIILAILLAFLLRPGVTSSAAAIAFVTWPGYGRLVRSEVLRVRSSDYVQLARVAGLQGPRLVWGHVVPNVLNAFAVLVTLNIAIAVLISAALSFLGLGVEPPQADWGNMLAEGVRLLNTWWMVVLPGAAVTALILASNTAGDWVRDALDPRAGWRVKPAGAAAAG